MNTQQFLIAVNIQLGLNNITKNDILNETGKRNQEHTE